MEKERLSKLETDLMQVEIPIVEIPIVMNKVRQKDNSGLAIPAFIDVETVTFEFDGRDNISCHVKAATYLSGKEHARRGYVEGTRRETLDGHLGAFGFKFPVSPKIKKALLHFLTKSLEHKYLGKEKAD